MLPPRPTILARSPGVWTSSKTGREVGTAQAVARCRGDHNVLIQNLSQRLFCCFRSARQVKRIFVFLVPFFFNGWERYDLFPRLSSSPVLGISGRYREYVRPKELCGPMTTLPRCNPQRSEGSLGIFRLVYSLPYTWSDDLQAYFTSGSETHGAAMEIW